MKRNAPEYMRVRALCKKIAYQFPSWDDEKNDIVLPEEKLMFSVIERAIIDLIEKKHRRTAMEYLQQEIIPEAEICGVDSNWVRDKLTKAKICDFGSN